jgi:hypothetical protein
LTVSDGCYIWFFLEGGAEHAKMVLQLVEGGVDVAFGIVGAAEGNIDDVMCVFFCVPAAQVRLNLLALVHSQA